MIGTYSLCLSLGVSPFSLRLGANVGSWRRFGRIQGPGVPTHCGNRRFTGSLTVEDVLIPQWPWIGGKKSLVAAG